VQYALCILHSTNLLTRDNVSLHCRVRGTRGRVRGAKASVSVSVGGIGVEVGFAVCVWAMAVWVSVSVGGIGVEVGFAVCVWAMAVWVILSAGTGEQATRAIKKIAKNSRCIFLSERGRVSMGSLYSLEFLDG